MISPSPQCAASTVAAALVVLCEHSPRGCERAPCPELSHPHPGCVHTTLLYALLVLIQTNAFAQKSIHSSRVVLVCGAVHWVIQVCPKVSTKTQCLGARHCTGGSWTPGVGVGGAWD